MRTTEGTHANRLNRRAAVGLADMEEAPGMAQMAANGRRARQIADAPVTNLDAQNAGDILRRALGKIAAETNATSNG